MLLKLSNLNGEIVNLKKVSVHTYKQGLFSLLLDCGERIQFPCSEQDARRLCNLIAQAHDLGEPVEAILPTAAVKPQQSAEVVAEPQAPAPEPAPTIVAQEAEPPSMPRQFLTRLAQSVKKNTRPTILTTGGA